MAELDYLTVDPVHVLAWFMASLYTDEELNNLLDATGKGKEVRKALVEKVGMSLLESTTPETEPKSSTEWFFVAKEAALNYVEKILNGGAQDRLGQMLIEGKEEKYS